MQKQKQKRYVVMRVDSRGRERYQAVVTRGNQDGTGWTAEIWQAIQFSEFSEARINAEVAWQVADKRTRRPVAVHELRLQLHQDPEFLTQKERENE